jgi:uncharacterized membrane protein YhhN
MFNSIFFESLPLISLAGFTLYWAWFCWRETHGWGGTLTKTVAVGALAVLAARHSGDGFYWIMLGLGCGALGDLALSRKGQDWFLLGMGAFCAGHLAYAWGFWHRSAEISQGVPFAMSAGQMAVTICLVCLMASTEFWLAPRTGALRWPVRAYVLVIGIMGVSAILLAPYPALYATPFPAVIAVQLGAGLFVMSDLLLALRLFVARDGKTIRLLSLTLWPAYWLGQLLIFAGAWSYWISPFK